ncbi:MAG: hypothetical protein COA67_03605 [Lutibacter sp.]|nr:MAG: hypothetical protein COA67_03605 [Lutibacter sp.]
MKKSDLGKTLKFNIFILFVIGLFSFQGQAQTCGSTITTYPYSENFELGRGAWTEDGGDDFDWTHNSGGTPSSNTGPSTGDGDTWYMFTEASAPRSSGDIANLESPCFDLTSITNPQFTFSYHMYGADMGTLNVDVSTDNGSNYLTTLWTQTGAVQTSNGQAYNTVDLDLTAYVGQTIKLRFNGIRGSSWGGDMAIDNVSLDDVVPPTPDPLYTIYYENFDANNGSWTATNPGAQTVWTHGLNAGISGGTEGNHWYTDNYNNYANNSETFATSPVIDLTGFNNLKFLIDIRYITESTFDGMNIEYYDGSTWTILGAYAATPVDFWYNDTDVDGIANNVDGWSGTNPNEVGTSAFSDFITASISLPSALNNNANVRFRVQFATDGSGTDDGANFDNVIIQGDHITPLSDPTYAPGAVTTNLKLWLKANSGTSTTTDGNALSSWSDEAYDNDAIGITTTRPTYNNSAAENINFNPVVNFVNSSRHEMRGKGGYYSQDYFAIVEPNTAYDAATTYGQQIIAGKFSTDNFSQDGSGLAFGLISARYTNAVVAHTISSFPNGSSGPNNTSYGRAFEDASATLGGVMLVNVKTNAADSSTEIYINGEQIDNDTGQAGNGADLNFNEFENLQYYLGTGRFTINDHGVNGTLDGKISEILSYSVKNSVADKQKIQSSLAIKYGITLHEGTQTTETDVNYVDSDGTIIWNATTNAGYNYHIAGIGSDAAAELNQKQSKTVNTAVDLTMGLTSIEATNSANANTFAVDKNFIVWGNDLQTLAVQAAIPVDMSAGISGLNSVVDFRPSGRTWKVVETGSVGTAKISVPHASILAPLGLPPGAYLMFISPTPTFAPTAEYRVMTTPDAGTTYETDFDFDANDATFITFGFAPEYEFVRSIAFDGTDDYLDSGDVIDLETTVSNPTGSFTISAWINKDANDGSIVSKRNDGATLTSGYDFSINSSGDLVMAWINAGTRSITSSIPIPSDIWHHVAVIYDGTDAKLYIDGIEDTAAVATTLATPLNTTNDFRIATGGTAASYFDGNIDEVRVFDVALTEDQLRFIMNQEIEENIGNNISGAYFNRGLLVPSNLPPPPLLPITPTKNDINAVPWANLQAYYPMSRYTFTNTRDESTNDFTAALKQIITVDHQTSPIPYVSSGASTDWNTDTTWTNGTQQTIPGATSILDNTKTIDWNIVEINDNVSMSNSSLPTSPLGVDNRTLLALVVNSNELTIDGTPTTGNGISISHYLKLNGVLDLQGESQLIQTDRSDLATSSSGYIEKDQQGTANSFTYNYWSSPVSLIGTGANNVDCFIDNILNYDRSTPATFCVGAFCADDAAINTSIRWLYKFTRSTNDYANWVAIEDNTATVSVTEGFTMKGVSAASSIATEQNYTFRGKPNNVLNGATQIVHTSFSNPQVNPLIPEVSLAGNPFPSALDADQFITDNLSSTDGQLYFWEHWGGGTHEWAQYQGGYAIRVIGVGNAATSHPDVSQTGIGLKIPGQYVPVGQGFYVISDSDGGDVVFNNTQRQFAKEGGSSVFVKQSSENIVNQSDNIDRMIIGLGFKSSEGFYRPVTVAFGIEGATDDFDRGYDGRAGNFLSNDALFMHDDKYYVIQSMGEFSIEKEIPLVVFVDEANNNATQTFMIDRLVNVPDEVEIYIRDNVNGETYDIRNQDHEFSLETGEHKTKYSLVFVEQTLSVDEEELYDGFTVFMNNTTSTIDITKTIDAEVKKVTLFNYLGQTIQVWAKDLSNNELILPVNKTSTGVYILKIETENKTLSKKLIIE